MSKGLRIRFRDEVVEISSDYDANILIYRRHNRFHVNVGAYEKKTGEDDLSHIWIDSSMETRDELIIEVVDIDNSTAPRISKPPFSSPPPMGDEEIKEMYSELLDRFYTLEGLLKKEGLLL